MKAGFKGNKRAFQKETEVIYEALADIHVSGHACQEELSLFTADKA